MSASEKDHLAIAIFPFVLACICSSQRFGRSIPDVEKLVEQIASSGLCQKYQRPNLELSKSES
jgi:hypothetical protein